MSTSIDQAFIKQYESEVHLDYQQFGSVLRGTVRTRNGVTGESTTFQKIAAGAAATTKTRHGVVPALDLDHSNVVATMQDNYAAEYIDKLDLLKTNIDERAALTRSIAGVMGRKTDDILVAAISSASNTTAITLSTEAAIRNSILAAVQALMERDIPFDGMVYGWIPPSVWSAFMTVEEFQRSDYVGEPLPYKGVKAKSWLDINWIYSNRLPLSSTTRSGFIFHKNSVGHAIAQDIQSSIDWIPEKVAWFLCSNMSQGAVLIDNDGVQALTRNEATALPTS